MSDLPACRICGFRDHWLGNHVVEVHNLSLPSYLRQYPAAPVVSAVAYSKIEKNLPKPAALVPANMGTGIKIRLAGVEVKVNSDVPSSACLPLPEHYRIPKHGELAQDVAETVICLSKRRSTYIWGPQGTGKDAIVHAFSALTRTPGRLFQIEPNVDIQSWFYSREFNKDGTFWQEGDLLRYLRDGYTTPSHRKIPYIILITDFDRATKEQAEALRLVMDSIAGRVKGPAGKIYNVFPGTLIVVTANTAGGGDSTGRYVSANVIDSSILDRFERALQFHTMQWEDEEPILKNKHPLLVEKFPKIFPVVGKTTQALRAAVTTETIYAQFSMRVINSWLGAAEDILSVVPDMSLSDLLRRSFRTVSDKMPDKETADNTWHCLDPHIKDGALPDKKPTPKSRK